MQKVWKEGKVSRERKEGGKNTMVRVERVGENRGRGVRRAEKRREGTRKRAGGKRKEKECREWQEERVRVGTGYRVRWAGREGEREKGRVLDLGYGHRRKHKLPLGMEVTRGKNHMSRILKRKGEKARERVMNEVCKRERRRPRSVYTGCGRTRKSRVGKKKLKPTKVRAI